jgi:hypothetical protein
MQTDEVEGQLSLFSPSSSSSSSSSSSGLRQVGHEIKKVYHMNQCLLYAKGLARWVGVWDTDEMLVPRQPGRTITQVRHHSFV